MNFILIYRTKQTQRATTLIPPKAPSIAFFASEMLPILEFLLSYMSLPLNNKDFNFFEAIEKSLELESWMTDDKTWNNDVQIAEATLNVEDWMINNEFWQ